MRSALGAWAGTVRPCEGAVLCIFTVFVPPSIICNDYPELRTIPALYALRALGSHVVYSVLYYYTPSY